MSDVNTTQVPDTTGNAPTAANTNTATGGGGGGGDVLDKGVDYVEKKTGHQQSHSTTEKISDGIRKGFKKLTGKDVPVKDQDYH